LLANFPNVPYVYLKTDSVLRGNLSAAFAALFQVRGGPVVFVPAYPKAKRTTISGEQLVDGIKLENSAFANDPRNPSSISIVRAILNFSHRVECINITKDKSTPALDEKGRRTFIFDCETQDDLMRVGDMLSAKKALSLTAGCAGFAEILRGYIPFERLSEKFEPVDQPVLFLSGSTNKATLDQLAYGAKSGIPIIKVSPSLKTSGFLQGDLDHTFAQLEEHLEQGRSAILATALTPDDLVELMPESRHGDIQRIFALAARYFSRKRYQNLCIFGGDTGAAVLRELDIGCVRSLDEIKPGIPLSVAYDLNIATKAGGLGPIDAVTAIEKYLRP
jgi:uncharacterized protein YgbK (DUF1537 family)